MRGRAGRRTRAPRIAECACWGVLLSALFVLPSAMIHEAGHVAACLAGNPGAQWSLDVGADGARVWCSGTANLPAYHASGGLAAAAAAGAAAALPQVRRRQHLFAAASATFAWHLSTSVVETLAHTWYVASNSWMWAMPVVLVAVPLALCARRRRAAAAAPSAG